MVYLLWISNRIYGDAMIHNPPWSTRIKTKNKKEILEAGLPMPTDVELGSGHYGAVYETEDPRFVFKITSDPTEGRFIREITKKKLFMSGMVAYKAIIDLEGTFRKRPVYGIWREAAVCVGLSQCPVKPTQERAKREASVLLRAFVEVAGAVRASLKNSKNPKRLLKEAHDQWQWSSELDYLPTNRAVKNVKMLRGSYKVAAGFEYLSRIASEMASTNLVYSIGESLIRYLDHGILLADVHENNIGVVMRDSYPQWVITDPGHALFLSDYL